MFWSSCDRGTRQDLSHRGQRVFETTFRSASPKGANNWYCCYPQAGHQRTHNSFDHLNWCWNQELQRLRPKVWFLEHQRSSRQTFKKFDQLACRKNPQLLLLRWWFHPRSCGVICKMEEGCYYVNKSWMCSTATVHPQEILFRVGGRKKKALAQPEVYVFIVFS